MAMESEMPALGSTVQSYIADGFADDCDELIHQCLQGAPVTYGIFSKIFRQMQMTCIFHNRHLGAEIAELSEEVINVAKHYMLANTCSFEETVTGLFLVYALVTTQPFTNFAYLRLVDEDVPLIERIEQVARREKRTDVLYVLGRLLVEYSRYHAAPRERGMEPPFRKYLEGISTIETLGLRPKGVFLRQNEELEVIKELAVLQIRYDAAKTGMKAMDLNYTNSKLPGDLDSSLKNLVSGIITNTNIGDDNNTSKSARTIKERAMRTKVDGMKHLIAVKDRSPTKATTSQKSDIKTPVKTKVGNIENIIQTNKKMKKQALPQKRKRKNSNNSEEELYDEQSDAGDVQFLDKTKSVKHFADDEIQVVNQNIKFAGLPSVIKCSDDDGRRYEIEIIDELKPCTDNKSTKEKRDLKKTLLKSRLKRLGIDVTTVPT